MTRRPIRALTVLSGLALSFAIITAPAVAQQDVTLDFEELATPTTPEFGIPSPVVEDGFILSTGAGLGDFAVWGNDPSDPGFVNYPGSTALFAAAARGRIDLTYEQPLLPFHLFSMDVAPLFGTEALGTTGFSTFTLRFFGFLAASPSSFNDISQDFTVSTPGSGNPTFTTLLFNNDWRGLDRVVWFQQSLTPLGTVVANDEVLHQFDNISLQVVPEPGTLLLLTTGLAALSATGFVRRRRAGALN